MRERHILWFHSTRATIMRRHSRRLASSSLWLRYSMLVALTLLFAACSITGTGDTMVAAPTAIHVNGFGTAANHPHSFMAFPNNVLVMATHYGTFWSGNDGVDWTEVAGGSGQIMDGLMTYSLTSSSLNPQRLYELTLPAISAHKGVLGLYTSTDQGRSWKLSITEKSLTPDEEVYLTSAGNDSADQVYVYIPALGTAGLKVSEDAGAHFHATGTLPFDSLTVLLALPGAPGHLLAASSVGMASSTDGGMHWAVIKGITGGIFSVATAGPGKPIYASGDEGVYASTDGGKTFKLVNAGIAYGSLTASTVDSQVLYGRTGTSVYRSVDGGRSWRALPHIAGNLFGLEADPKNAEQVYLSLSYPTEVYHFEQAGQKWVSLTPKP